MKKIFTKLFLLAAILMLSSELWAQAPEYVTCSSTLQSAEGGYATRVILENTNDYDCSPDVISFKTTAQQEKYPFQRASVYGDGGYFVGYFEDIGLSDIHGAIMCSLEQNFNNNPAGEQSYTFNLPEGLSGQYIYGLMIEHGPIQFKDFKITNYYYEWNPSKSVNSAASTYSFEVNYSEYGLPTKASDLSVELTGDNSSAFKVTSEDLGNKVIYTVTYNHNSVGNHKARLKVNYSCTICGNPVTGHARALNLHGQTTKVTPTVNAWPTLNAVTYGTNFGKALQLKGGSASVSGTFAITNKYNAENVPNAGTYNYNVTFTPKDVSTYNTVNKYVVLTVNKADQAIAWTATPPTEMTVGDSHTLSATATSGDAVDFAISGEAAKLDDNTLTAEQAGTVTITASQAGNGNYNPAANVTHSIRINKATPTVTAWPTIAPVTYGTNLGAALVLKGGSASVAGTFVITDSYNAADVPNAGTHTYNVTFTPSESNKYNNVSGGTATLTVNKAGQAIAWTATPPTEMTVGDSHTLSATATSGDAVDFAISGEAAKLDDNTLTAVREGTVTITASQAGNGNYNAAANVTHSIKINKATPTVNTWPTLDAVTYGARLEQALVLVDGEASVAGTFAITDSYNAADVPNAGTHTYNLEFRPTESNKYNNVPGGTATLTVNKANQTITWDFADCTLLPGQTLALDATSTCGDVSYELTGSAIISVSGNTLTAKAAGTATIKAVDAGNSNYNAVESSVYTITVSASGYTRTVTNGNYGTICLPYGSSNYSGADFYEIAYAEIKEGDATGLYLDQIEEGAALLAGKPYIFKATADELTVSYEGAMATTLVAGDAGLTGTLVDIAAGGVLVGNYIIAQNMFWDASAENWLNANRAYINKATLLSVPPKSLVPGRRRVSMGETSENAATDVENTQLPMINSHKLIENGQLIIIRDGVKYNAMGQKL